MYNLAEVEVAWWNNYGWVWRYRKRQGHLFTPSAYFKWSKVRDIPLNNFFPPDFPCHCRAEIVCWVSENKWPFNIVTDRGFWSLMKTGRPGYCLPSAETASRDTRVVFINVQRCIAKMLQVSTWLIYIFLMMNSPSMNHCRSTQGHWASQPMHGHPPTTRRIWQSRSILKTKACLSQCFLTLWNLHARILASIWQPHLRRSLKILGLITRWAIYLVERM